MKKLYILAALLMASTSAYAGNSVSVEFQGRKLHIEAPENCDSLSCLQISAPGLTGSNFDSKDLKSAFNGDKSPFNRDNDDIAPANPPAPKTVAAPAAPQPPSAAGPALAGPGLAQILSVVTAMVPTAPGQGAAAPAASAPLSAPAAVAPKPAPVVAAIPAPVAAVPAPVAAAPAPVAVAPTPVAAPTSPLGVWNTEQNKGTVRIEQCGQNLCGFATKTGEKVLINMKPTEAKWTGQIHDPDSGRNYDSTIAMKGPNSLRVQGCAFGGMFCGGQTWNRVS